MSNRNYPYQNGNLYNNYNTQQNFTNINNNTMRSQYSNFNNSNNNINNYYNEDDPNYQTQYAPYSRPRSLAIKWRGVMKIDLDHIRKTKDLSMLEAYLENMIYAEVSEEEIQKVPEANIAKLIEILQFSGEYLISSQQTLENKINALQEEHAKLNNENLFRDNDLLKNKELLNRLKKEKKRNLEVLMSYKNVIDSLTNGNFVRGAINKKITDINIDVNKFNSNNINSNTLRNSRPGKFNCIYCQGASFDKEDELKKHMTDIHLLGNGGPNSNNNQVNFQFQQIPAQQPKVDVQFIDNGNQKEMEKKLGDLRTQLNNALETMRVQDENNRKMMLERQRQNDLNKNNNDTLNNFQNQIKQTMSNFHEEYLKILKEQKPNEQKILLEYPPQENVPPPKKKVGYTQEQIELLNKLKEQVLEFKKHFLEIKTDHENVIKQLQEENENLKKQLALNNSKNFEEEKYYNLRVSSQIKGLSFKKVDKKKQEIKPKEKYKKKIKFNAGDIESDHDDDKKEIKIMPIPKPIIKPKPIQLPVPEEKIPEVEKLPEPVLAQSQFRSVGKINLKQPEKLDQYYRKYILRDNGYITDPDWRKYIVNTLDKTVLKDKNLENNSRENLNNKIYKTSNGIDFNQLPNQDIENLVRLISDKINNNEQIFSKDNINSYYYSINECININEIIGDINTILKRHQGINIMNYRNPQGKMNDENKEIKQNNIPVENSINNKGDNNQSNQNIDNIDTTVNKNQENNDKDKSKLHATKKVSFGEPTVIDENKNKINGPISNIGENMHFPGEEKKINENIPNNNQNNNNQPKQEDKKDDEKNYTYSSNAKGVFMNNVNYSNNNGFNQNINNPNINQPNPQKDDSHLDYAYSSGGGFPFQNPNQNANQKQGDNNKLFNAQNPNQPFPQNNPYPPNQNNINNINMNNPNVSQPNPQKDESNLDCEYSSGGGAFPISNKNQGENKIYNSPNSNQPYPQNNPYPPNQNNINNINTNTNNPNINQPNLQKDESNLDCGYSSGGGAFPIGNKNQGNNFKFIPPNQQNNRNEENKIEKDLDVPYSSLDPSNKNNNINPNINNNLNPLMPNQGTGQTWDNKNQNTGYSSLGSGRNVPQEQQNLEAGYSSLEQNHNKFNPMNNNFNHGPSNQQGQFSSVPGYTEDKKNNNNLEAGYSSLGQNNNVPNNNTNYPPTNPNMNNNNNRNYEQRNYISEPSSQNMNNDMGKNNNINQINNNYDQGNFPNQQNIPLNSKDQNNTSNNGNNSFALKSMNKPQQGKENNYKNFIGSYAGNLKKVMGLGDSKEK